MQYSCQNIAQCSGTNGQRTANPAFYPANKNLKQGTHSRYFLRSEPAFPTNSSPNSHKQSQNIHILSQSIDSRLKKKDAAQCSANLNIFSRVFVAANRSTQERDQFFNRFSRWRSRAFIRITYRNQRHKVFLFVNADDFFHGAFGLGRSDHPNGSQA